MKISVLTPTYNREKLLKKLYESLLKNANYGIQIEWLIMDDGSKDQTRTSIEKFKEENKIEIKYYYQENQGKMVAINKLVKQATGELMIECDSDDYFTDNAFQIIKEEYEKKKEEKGIYALCFLKYNTKGENIGKKFNKTRTTMFDLYFREGENGEKALVFISKIRKEYEHKIEHNEKFVTEARMYHKMDEKYQIICINKPIMICEYQKDGYTKNIQKEFKENPHGYYEYFKEILEHDFSGINFKKRLYVIKHYILFSYLTKSKITLKNIKSLQNKIICCILYVPGVIKTKNKFKL